MSHQYAPMGNYFKIKSKFNTFVKDVFLGDYFDISLTLCTLQTNICRVKIHDP